MILTKYLLINLVVKDIWTDSMSVSSLLELEVLATAKKYNSNVVADTHLVISCYKFLLEKGRITLGGDFDKIYSKAIEFEEGRTSIDIGVPTMTADILSKINGCQKEQDVYGLLNKYLLTEFDPKATSKPSITFLPQGEQIKESKKQGGFHVPLGDGTVFLPRIMQDKNLSMHAILPYLEPGETYVWDGPYNTADPQIVTRHGQSQGRLFVTNHRLLFWSDDTRKPQAGIYYEDIMEWKTSWMPLKNRGVALHTGLTKVIFIANSTAVKHADYQILAKKGRS